MNNLTVIFFVIIIQFVMLGTSNTNSRFHCFKDTNNDYLSNDDFSEEIPFYFLSILSI